MLLICIFSLVSDGKTLRTSEFEYGALKPRCPNPLKEPLMPLICKWKVCKDLMLLLKKSAPRLTAAPLLRNAVTRWNKQLLKRITWVCIWEDEKLIDMNNLSWCNILYKWNRRESESKYFTYKQDLGIFIRNDLGVLLPCFNLLSEGQWTTFTGWHTANFQELLEIHKWFKHRAVTHRWIKLSHLPS